MTENQPVETLTAKASELDASPAAPKKGKSWVKPLIWALSIVLALCVGTAVGGGLVYGIVRVKDRMSLRTAIPSIRSYRSSPGDVTVDIPAYGALIVEVTEGSPAERAGLEQGSVIVAVDGQELDAERGLAERIAGFKPGDKVTLQIWEPGGRRVRRTAEVEVTLGEHPEREGAAYLGVTFVPFPGMGPRMQWERPFGEFEFHFEGEEAPRSFRFFGLPGREGRGAEQWFEFRGLPHDEDVDWSDLFGDSI